MYKCLIFIYIYIIYIYPPLNQFCRGYYRTSARGRGTNSKGDVYIRVHLLVFNTIELSTDDPVGIHPMILLMVHKSQTTTVWMVLKPW